MNLSDADFVIELVNSPGWLTYIGDRNIKTRADAEQYLTNGPIASYNTHGFGLSIVEEYLSGHPLGICGLLKREYLPAPDLGFAFLPKHEGKGFAFEASTAYLTSYTEGNSLKPVYAITLRENTRSIALLTRLGFLFDQEIKPDKEPLLLYCLNKKAVG